MGKKRNYFLNFILICLLFFTTAFLSLKLTQKQNVTDVNNNLSNIIPTPFEPFPYNIPNIPKTRSYRIVLVGDSIVGSLGPNANLLRLYLIELYPEHEFVNYNYGFGATNIETLPERLTKVTEHDGVNYPSILSQGFEMVIIESFAYNPLSHESSYDYIEKHIRILDESIRKIIKNKSNAVVAIMTPIAPNKKLFAKGVYDLTQAERVKWANERIAIINSVTEYANKNNIPLINVYEKSLNAEGSGDLKYINPDDYIHPSHKGVDLIARTIAQFIYDTQIFPR